MEENERQKMLFLLDIESEIKYLDFQRKRIFESPTKENSNIRTTSNHDADFYVILLRRLLRRIESTARYDSRVANLKGKFRDLCKKIKIRDHFEHEIDYNKVSQIFPGITITKGTVINDTKPHIISGDKVWLLNEDHEKFKNLVEEFSKLYPFTSVI